MLASAYRTLWNATTIPSATPASSQTPTTTRATTLARTPTTPGGVRDARQSVDGRTRRGPATSLHTFHRPRQHALLPGPYGARVRADPWVSASKSRRKRCRRDGQPPPERPRVHAEPYERPANSDSESHSRTNGPIEHGPASFPARVATSILRRHRSCLDRREHAIGDPTGVRAVASLRSALRAPRFDSRWRTPLSRRTRR